MQLGCDIGGAKEPGVMYFPTNWGAKERQNPQNHRVGNVFVFHLGVGPTTYLDYHPSTISHLLGYWVVGN